MRKKVFQHLDVQPGGDFHSGFLPDDRAKRTVERRIRTFRDLHGFLKGKTNAAQLGIDEIDDAIAEIGADAGGSGRNP